MSIQNLTQGVKELVEGIKGRKEAKIAAQNEQRLNAARNQLGDELLSSTEGQTTRVKLLGQGLKSGLLKPNEAISQLGTIDRSKLYFALHAKAMTTSDPTQKAQLMQTINQMSDVMNKINREESYFKSLGQAYGNLQARKDFGVLNKGRGGRGGGGGGGASNEQTLAGQSNIKTMTVPLPFLGSDFQEWMKKDPVGKSLDPSKSYLQQGLSDKQIDGFRERAIGKLREHILNQGKLKGIKDGDKVSQGLALQQMQEFSLKGVDAFSGTYNSEGLKRYLPFAVDVPLDDEDLLDYSQGASSQGDRIVSVKKGKKNPPKIFVRPNIKRDLSEPTPSQPGVLDKVKSFFGVDSNQQKEIAPTSPVQKSSGSGGYDEDFRKQMLQ